MVATSASSMSTVSSTSIFTTVSSYTVTVTSISSTSATSTAVSFLGIVSSLTFILSIIFLSFIGVVLGVECNHLSGWFVLLFLHVSNWHSQGTSQEAQEKKELHHGCLFVVIGCLNISDYM